MRKLFVLFISLSLLLMACHRRSVPSALPGEGKLITEIGIASYYSNKFDGKPTSSGEVFHQNKLTGAHRELPFNTLVKVTNLSNNKSVIIRINDRGPFIKGRLIDLSRSAAEKLDMIEAGIIKVKIEYHRP